MVNIVPGDVPGATERPGRVVMPEIVSTANPSADAWSYPGEVLSANCVVTESWIYAVNPVAGEPFGRWRVNVDDGRLARPGIGVTAVDEFLARNGDPTIGQRHAMLAIGSNASPSQLRHKFAGADFTIPAARVLVTGLAVGHSAHVSRAGYVPYAAYDADDEDERPYLMLWLDDDQLAKIDSTEPNYERAAIGDGRYPMRLDSGAGVHECLIYRGRWGILRTAPGIVAAMDQAGLMRALGDESPA